MNKYNISHLKLLRLIKKNKIKNNTKIYCNDLVVPLIFANGTLNYLNCYDELEPISFREFIENIGYAKFMIEK